MIIREATEPDLPDLIRLLRRSWLRHWAPELPFVAVRSFVADDPARSYVNAMWPEFHVAAVRGTAVGMCHVVDDFLAAIHVDPAYHGQGIGSALMDHAEGRIGESFSTARLEVIAFNTPAISFYSRRGWTETTRYRTTECGAEVEAIEMRKALTGA